MPHSPVPPCSDVSAGQRIQAIRKQRGLTQRGLAQRAHISYSSVTKVESGHAAATPTVVAACARALRVPVTEITGQPYREALREDQLDDFVQPLRHTIASPVLPDEDAPPPRPLEKVREEVRALGAGRQRGDYLAIGVRGAGLLVEAEHLARAAPAGRERELAHRTLAEMYGLARYFAHRLGFPDLGLLALDRMEAAAEQSGDPYLRAVSCHHRADYLMHHGAYEAGLRALRSTERQLEDPVRRGEPRALSVQGTLHLKAAVILSRCGWPGAARDMETRLGEARGIATRLEGTPDPYGMVFDSANVAIHSVSTRIDLGEAGAAVEQGKRVRLPEGWARSRTGHHHMDMARGYEQVARREEALKSLFRARAAAPQQVRHHPTTRETVLALLRGRGTPSTALRGYARWVGI